MKQSGGELVAPAGSFAAGLAALEGGADAVYAGLESFSARSRAKNFTTAQLSRLLSFAHGRGQKVYVALNTLIQESELPHLCRVLEELAWLSPDGVILQDLGLLHLLRQYLPQLPVHASTQLAVYDVQGAAWLQQAGVKRVVLARELGREQIRYIHSRLPGLELEVFIHGALCYSVSGLCLASGMLLNRSANRGECAQICRTWFSCRGEKGYFFSCNDLALKEQIADLVALGVSALKIEGRMKDPAYAGLAAAYYRSLLSASDPALQQQLFTRLNLAFSRRATNAFFIDSRGADLINVQYPSRTGIPAGEILAVQEQSLLLRLTCPLQVRDGLMFFGAGSPPAAVSFGIRGMQKAGQTVYSAVSGDDILIFHQGPLASIPAPGSFVFKVSAADQHSAQVKPGSYCLSVYPLAGRIHLQKESLRFELAPFPPLPYVPAGEPSASSFSYEISCRPEAARGNHDFRELLCKLFRQSADAYFRIQELSLHNTSGLPDAAVFLPPGFLKAFKNAVYTGLEAWLARRREAWLNGMLAEPCDQAASFIAAAGGSVQSDSVRAVADGSVQSASGRAAAGGSVQSDSVRAAAGRSVRARSEMVCADLFARAAVAYGPWRLPFAVRLPHSESEPLACWREWYILALPPVLIRPEHYFEQLLGFLKAREAEKILIGLNNVSQLQWVEKLAIFPGVSFFVDYGLYCSNRFAFAYYAAHVPRLMFILYWVEGPAYEYELLADALAAHPVALLRCAADFRPHLFLSRVCYRRHSLQQSCRTCNKSAGSCYFLEQNQRHYRVVVQDCISYLFAVD